MKVTVVSGGSPYIEHRELIGGAIINGSTITIADVSAINNRVGYSFGDSGYDARYDINGNREIDVTEVSLVKSYQGFTIDGYIETHDWIMEYRQ